MDHHRVFDAGDDPQRPATGRAGLDVDAKDAFEPLRPSHRCSTFHRRLLLPLIGSLGFGALPPFRRCHRGAVSTVGGKYAVQARQVDPRLGHQGGESGDEVERLEDDMRGAIAVRCLEPPVRAVLRVNPAFATRWPAMTR